MLKCLKYKDCMFEPIRVMKASAKNIIPGQDTSTVAVKMLKG